MNDTIAARNRANAQKSTGPRTEEGKAIVAMNARRHGATGRPDRESVTLWLSVILDRPEISPVDLMPGDDVGYRALALAEAEARVVATERALRAFEAGSKPAADRYPEDLQGLRKVIKDAEKAGTLQRTPQEVALMFLVLEDEFRQTQPGSHKHRLLQRYVGEAKAVRRHAFETWAAIKTAMAESASNPKTSDSRNKARFQS